MVPIAIAIVKIDHSNVENSPAQCGLICNNSKFI
jgi:hypothetical protein